MPDAYIDPDSWQRMSLLMEKHCPRLMRQGGGPLEQEQDRRATGRTCAGNEERLRKLSAMGLAQKEIGERLGVHQAVVSKWQRRLGITPNGKLPNGT